MEKERLRKEEKVKEALDVKNLKNKWANEDLQFFEYGNELYNYANSNGRPTYPIEKVIKVSNLSCFPSTWPSIIKPFSSRSTANLSHMNNFLSIFGASPILSTSQNGINTSTNGTNTSSRLGDIKS